MTRLQNKRLAMIINFLAFQAGWFLCVQGAANHHLWLGPAFTPVLLTLHFVLLKPRVQELALVLIVGLLGTVLDSGLIKIGIFSATFPSLMPWPCPFWLTCIWFLFASIQTVSLRWLWGRPGMALFLGGVGGPLAYYMGAHLGAIHFEGNLALALLSLGSVWAVTTWVVSIIAEKLDGESGSGLVGKTVS